MARVIELDPVDRLTAGAVGEPGKRVFYLQARQDQRLVTILVEKQQVELLAASLVEILARAGRETGEGPPEEEMGLEEPVVPEWRAGRISIGYDEDRDMILLEAEEVAPQEEEEELGEPETGSDLGRVRLWASREQALALARHGAAVAAAGRPRCQLCGNPLDPEGHVCPALNGQHA
ncbi:MAG TPA: DUF3090 family protein [Actinomycetota bacterium]|nr:DUF3090 family protein [Actinomycetota bacterium]